jgi:hypothetical protein
MTFLNPVVLFGLAAAAIPVILHLMNLRKLRTIEFSTLTFLKELQQTRIRRLKLRQFLLLLIRTLLVAAVVMAFARPAIKGTLGIGGSQAHSTMVIILDDSFSMTASDEHGEYFRQARESALRLLDLLKDGDEVILLKLSDLPAATIAPATHNTGLVRTAISESRVSAVRRPVAEAVSLANQLLHQSHNPNREIYVISDLQNTLFDPAGKGAQPADPSTRIAMIPVGGRTTPNAAIDSVTIGASILELEKPVSLRILVRNYSPAPLANSVLSAYLDGTKSAQKTISVGAWGSQSAEITVVPKRTGLISGAVELEDDALPQDNKRWFTLRIPERITVGIIAGAPQDAEFLRLALTAGGDQSLFSITDIAARQLSYTDITPFDVIACVNVPSVPAADAERLHGACERGTGLLFFPGNGMDIPSYNSALLPQLNASPITGLARSAGMQNPGLFSHVDAEHPLFASIFEQEKGDRREATLLAGTPRLTTWLRRQAGKMDRTIITLNDGSAFLTEERIGYGRVLIYGTAADRSWSDFPLKGIFAPLIHRSAVYVAPRDEQLTSFQTGDSPEIRLRSTPNNRSGEGRYTTVYPDGTEELIQPSAEQSGNRGSTPWLAFRHPQLRDPGIYQIRKGTAPIGMFAMNMDSRESDLRPLSDDTQRLFWTSFGLDPGNIRSIPSDERLGPAVLQSRFGLELWRHFGILALLLAIAEMIVARDSRASTRQAPTTVNA